MSSVPDQPGRPSWLALAADPAPLLGLPPVPRERDDDLLHRRDASFAAVQEHFYPDPPRIEREWRHHLAAADGRVYLDMVNNEAALGHSHPRIEAAVARELLVPVIVTMAKSASAALPTGFSAGNAARR